MKPYEKRKLGKTDLYVTPVAYGGIISTNEDQKDSDMYVSYAIDRGINYFDVAPAYGNAQEILGKSLIPHRKNINLACKTNEMGLEEGLKQMEESMKLLNTDYFDLYQLHALTSMEQLDLAFSAKGIMEHLVKLREKGIIRYIGFSAHDEQVALEAINRYDFDTVLFPFNWGTYIGKGFGKELIEKAREKNMGKLALKALAHRKWRENENIRYPKAWYKPVDIESEMAIAALKFTISLGVDVIVPPGHFDFFRFTVENYEECTKNPLNREELQILEKELVKPDVEAIF